MSGVFHWLQHLFTPTQSVPQFLLAIGIASVLFIALMAALHRLPPPAKKWLIIVTTFVAGLYFLLEFLLPTHEIKDFGQGNIISPTIEPVSLFVITVLIWTFFMGVISLFMVHGKRLIRRQPGWHNSLAFFLAMFAILVGGWISMNAPATAKASWASTLYDSLFDGLLVSLDATMFSLLAFYIASAAYRAFRVRTVEAALLMISALIVMLGMVNFGVWITSAIPADSGWAFLRIERLASWVLSWINSPTQRAVNIGVAIGSLAMAMRLWLNLERGAFFSQES